VSFCIDAALFTMKEGMCQFFCINVQENEVFQSHNFFKRISITSAMTFRGTVQNMNSF
jgi:hypothetical protein